MKMTRCEENKMVMNEITKIADLKPAKHKEAVTIQLSVIAMSLIDISKSLAVLADNNEALDMAIKALEQEPCEDCISRQAVMEHYSTGEIAHCHHISRNNLLDFIEQLPPVTPQPKMGHWIATDEEPHEDFECDGCGYTISTYTANIEPHTEYKYCPNCGAKMQEVEK